MVSKKKSQNDTSNIKKYNINTSDTVKKDSGDNLILHLKIKVDKKDDFPKPHDPNISNNYSSITKKDINEKKTKENESNSTIIRTMHDFIQNNWPEKTNVYCMWCCHPFDNIPCGIPEKMDENGFYLYGCFCTFNCTASYIFDKNLHDKWNKYSLLNMLYCKLYNKKFNKISLAPPKEILDIFGGHMKIKEYRKLMIKNNKTFKVYQPPIISIVPKIEEINNFNDDVNFIPVNKYAINKATNNILLKRNKPLIDENKTLKRFMDVKIV